MNCHHPDEQPAHAPAAEPAPATPPALELTIEKAVFEGHALARLGRHVIFVDGALPGERIRAVITRRRRRHAFARLLEILAPSPQRCAAPCPVFGVCGGCAFLNMAYPAQLAMKKGFLQDALRAWPAVADKLADVLGMESPEFFRNKMVYSFGGTAAEPVLGMHRRGDFHAVVTAEHCLLQSLTARAIIRRVTGWARARGLPPFDERTKQGLLRDLTVREGRRTGQRLVLLTATAPHPDLAALPEVLGDLADTVLLGFSPAAHNASRVERIETLKGPGRIEEQLNGLTFEIGPTTFFQTNTLQAERMFRTLAAWADELRPRVALDLYAGMGPIAFHLLAPGRTVLAVESHPESVAAARRNQERNRLPPIEWLTADVEQTPETIFARQPDLIVVDPPRTGLAPKAAARIAAAAAPHLIYVSCNPATLARDLPLFLRAGYVVERIQPVDMFPHAYHIECLVQFALALPL
ncbi:MAG: 23S rRNA (uracil(1939)-C(5))-methyltransferase RlmD [Kiritimatiellaeota bacterium]|nr:23S rRNA (uracil(1939)-C(5))-methyltransferase RlmD [Kiritimatiellota bacterium]